MTGKNDSMAMLGWKIPLTLLIWSVIVIGACSDTSPLYSFYPSPDPSIFFMFGRGLLHGLLPYVEMADSKGPLLVWIYYAAAWIDGHSFAGIFLIQCVTLFTTLLLACGTARFYLSQRGSLLASMLLCLFLFDSFPFQRGGGVEELCWPGMAAVVYGLVRYFRMRDRRSLLFLFGTAGVFAGAASMMKFSIAFPVCALGGVLCLWLWWNGRRKEAAVALGVALAGFLAVVVPCSAWLVSNGVLKEAMNEYLLCSVRYGTVSQDTTWWARLLRPAPVRCLSDVLMWVAVIWALAIAGWRQLKTQKALLFTALLYIFFKVEMFSVYNYYYNSILSPMMIWVTIFFVARAERRFSLCMPRMAAATLAIACLTGAGVAAGLTGAVRKGDFVWNGREFYSPAVRERLASFSEASVLYLGWLDRGFGITWDWKPCGRYWFLQNFPSEEMVREQYDYIEQGIPDIIHTSSRDDDSFLRQHGYKPLMPELDGGFWCRVSQGDGEPSPEE